MKTNLARTWFGVSALTVALVATGCGGGAAADRGAGSGTPVTPLPVPVFPVLLTATLPSEASRDGWVDLHGVWSADGANSGGLGDSTFGFSARRQFFSFDFGSLPADATILSAVLRLYQEEVAGSPYSTLGAVIADHLDYGDLDGFDYDLPALLENVGTLSSDAAIGWRTLDLSSAVRADLSSGRPRTQVRLRWSLQDSDGDFEADQARFTDAEDALRTGHSPALVITYTTP